MALRTLQAVVADSYNKESTDPMLAGDLIGYSGDTALGTTVNPPCVVRADRFVTRWQTRASIIGVVSDDALGTNPAGETPYMINNDPAGSNFVNGSVFQSYTAGFYVGVKRAIGDFKDESIDVVTNLTAGVPVYGQRGVSVYTTPSTKFITDRMGLVYASSATADAAGWYSQVLGGTTTLPQPGDILTVGSSNQAASVGNTNYTGTPLAPTNVSATNLTNNRGLLISAGSQSFTTVPYIGRVDYYDSGAGLLYYTLI